MNPVSGDGTTTPHFEHLQRVMTHPKRLAPLITYGVDEQEHQRPRRSLSTPNMVGLSRRKYNLGRPAMAVKIRRHARKGNATRCMTKPWRRDDADTRYAR